MRNRTILLMVVVGVFVCGLGLTRAETRNANPNDDIASVLPKGTLKGLEGVSVLVESLPSDAKQIGLTVNQIQTDVELRLRRNNIKILSELSYPTLYINVSIIKLKKSPLFMFCFDVELSQSVLLVRNPKKRCIATTWAKPRVAGYVPEARANNYIRQCIKDRVDVFINDYLAVNSRK